MLVDTEHSLAQGMALAEVPGSQGAVAGGFGAPLPSLGAERWLCRTQGWDVRSPFSIPSLSQPLHCSPGALSMGNERNRSQTGFPGSFPVMDL